MKWFVVQYGTYNLIVQASNWSIARETAVEALKRRVGRDVVTEGHGPIEIPTPDLKILDESYYPDMSYNSVYWGRGEK